MTVISDYLRTSGFWVRRSTQFQERLEFNFDFLHMLLCGSIQASFVCFVLLFLFHYETTTKAEFIFYTKEIGS